MKLQDVPLAPRQHTTPSTYQYSLSDARLGLAHSFLASTVVTTIILATGLAQNNPCIYLGGKQKRAHDDRYEEAVTQSDIDESQHGKIGRP